MKWLTSLNLKAEHRNRKMRDTADITKMNENMYVGASWNHRREHYINKRFDKESESKSSLKDSFSQKG